MKTNFKCENYNRNERKSDHPTIYIFISRKFKYKQEKKSK